VSQAKVLKEYDGKEITPELRDKVIKILKSEVEVYDAHIRGMCFGYIVEDDEGNQMDSCWGYHGYQSIDWDHALSEAREAAKSAEKNKVGSGI
jgi:hypothetical protein